MLINARSIGILAPLAALVLAACTSASGASSSAHGSTKSIVSRFQAFANRNAADGSTISSISYVRTTNAAAEAVLAGTIDLVAVEEMTAEMAIAHLTAVKGIGPWTAELYLLFSVGHPDIFPAGDLALKKAVRDGLGLEVLPSTKALVEIAKGWSPHRGAAALLFWRYFRVLNNREGVAA